jgi:adenylosuccinate synthase
MSNKRLYTVTDLGPGDGGKGGLLHTICHKARPHTVVKIGGAQGSHGVHTSHGEKFAFSQFGCGTLQGIRTHISDRFVMSPIGIIPEADALRYEVGVHDALSLLTVDGRALCSTPFHGIASRLRELARKNNPRGSVGTGVGEAYRDSLLFPEFALYASDLVPPNLSEKLEASRGQVILGLSSVLDMDFLASDQDEAQHMISLLNDRNYSDFVLGKFKELAGVIKIVSNDYEPEVILGRDGAVVYESSHGALTDPTHGFLPHTSKIRTLPQHLVWDLLEDWGYDGRVIKFAVSRAYQIRHGAGPMPTDSPALRDRLLTGAIVEEYDRYRGEVRVGALDLVSMRYGIAGCGGPVAFDALAIMCFDQVVDDGVWSVCHSYEGADSPEYFASPSEIRLGDSTCPKHAHYLEGLTQKLYGCRPIITDYVVPKNLGSHRQAELCNTVLSESLGIPVRVVSVGPTEKNKIFL